MGTPKVTLGDLEAWALEGNWEEIDRVIKLISGIPQFILWAVGRIDDDNNHNIRDAAASILEATPLDLAKSTERALQERLSDNIEGDSRFATFRAAFALFAHGDRSETVIRLVGVASTDEDEQVSQIAKVYLAQLEQEHAEAS